MKLMAYQANIVICVVGASLLAAAVAAQTPAAPGVVVVRAAGDVLASVAPHGLGFVAGETQVIASVDSAVATFVVSGPGAGGVEREARLVSYNEASGLGLLEVVGLTRSAYRFARDPASPALEIRGATRDADSGVVTFVDGQVQEVQPRVLG